MVPVMLRPQVGERMHVLAAFSISLELSMLSSVSDANAENFIDDGDSDGGGAPPLSWRKGWHVDSLAGAPTNGKERSDDDFSSRSLFFIVPSPPKKGFDK